MNEPSDILLAPPIEPSPVIMSYNGPGWIAIYILLALITLFITLRIVLSYRKNMYRRNAINALNLLSTSEPSSLLKAMSVLKSTAMKSYGRSEIAPLTGLELFDYFNRKYPAFDLQIAKKISASIYSIQTSLNVDEIRQFIAQSQNWIRKHDI